MVGFAEGSECRRAVLLRHFGEELAPGACTGCDNCAAPRESFDGTIAAQKFLSTVVRVRQASGFSVGLTHLADVLAGRTTEKVRAWYHDSLSTFGIGKGFAHTYWVAVGRELVRLGLLRQTPGMRSVIELTDAGRTTLRERQTVMLTAAPAAVASRSGKRSSPEAATDDTETSDESLFDELRALRKRLADERDVPAYVIFPDTTLRAMARDVPRNATEMRQIPGVGDKKLQDYGDVFLAALAAYASSREIVSRET
jgi:ATP-dependent DNA helicase RecQ